MPLFQSAFFKNPLFFACFIKKSTDIPHFFKKREWTAFLSGSRCRFEKAVLSDFRFAVQMSPKSNCIWTADKRMGGEVPCSSFSTREIREDSLF